MTVISTSKKAQIASFFAIATLVLLFFFLSTEITHAWLGDVWVWIRSRLLLVIHAILTSFPAILVWITGTLLNSTIYYLVVNMGDLINNQTGVGYAINNLWRVIRDTMNLLFIFGLIYIGIKTILNSEDSGTRKALAQLIAAAFLINFSLFISKVIIDFSNILATQIFSLFGQVSNIPPGASGGSGVSGAFMQALGVLNMLSARNFESFDLTAGIVYSLMTMVFLLITAFVFGAGAFLLLARFISLVIYMIFSPIMFLGWVLPSLKKNQSDWWSGFFQKAFFAPAYLFMLYLSYITLERFRVGAATNPDLSQILDKGFISSSGSMYTLLMFVFAAGMLIGSVIVAQKMSIAGAGTTMSMLKSVQKSAQGALARNTVGVTSNRMLKSLDRAQAESVRLDAQGGSEASRRAARRKLRTLSLAGGGSARVARATYEKGKKYGAGGASYADVKDYEDKRDARVSSANAVAQLQHTLENGSPQERAAALNRATNPQISELVKSQNGRDLVMRNIQYMPQNKINAIRDSKDAHITEDFKNQVWEGAQTANLNNLGGNPNNPDAEITNLNNAGKDQLDMIGARTLSLPQNAIRLRRAQIEQLERLRDEGKISPIEVQNIINTRERNLVRVAQGQALENNANTTMTRNNLLGDVETMSGLPGPVLVALAPHLTPHAIRRIADRVDVIHHSAIRRAYENSGVVPRQPTATGADGQFVANTPEERKWLFLHRDPIGRDFGTA